MFIKTIFKDSKKAKTIRNYVSKCNLYIFRKPSDNLLLLIYKNRLINADKFYFKNLNTLLLYNNNLQVDSG